MSILGEGLQQIWLPTPASLGPEEFERFRVLIYDRAGIALSSKKVTLVEARLGPRLLQLGLSGFSEYADLLEDVPREHAEWQEFVNRLTTNKTSWFREPEHFNHLREVASHANENFRAWCAACSTGEEAYTIACVLKEALPKAVPFSVLASDLDTKVLADASRGVYPRASLADVPEPLRKGNFSLGTGDIADWMRVSQSLRKSVEFRQQNLIAQPFSWKQPFDVIFCRNVFIYFDRATIERVVNAFAEVAKPKALLYIGHSETLSDLKMPWKTVQPAVYRLP